MFRKRQKKIFPPGTFISTPARICAIIQLCLAFTVLIWNVALPFTGELFTTKSKQLLYQDVIGISSSTSAPDLQKHARLARNSARFKALPSSQQAVIHDGYEKIQAHMQRPFVDKMGDGLRHLLFEMSGFAKVWLILSFVIPCLLLKKIEGAKQAVWLLPLLTACYAFQNRWEGSNDDVLHKETLFPSEQVLIVNYMPEPLSNDVFKQREQLLNAWNLYLIKEWAPSSIREEASLTFEQKVEEGEFAFNFKRLQHPPYNVSLSQTSEYPPRESLFILALYLFWNFLFAVIARKA